MSIRKSTEIWSSLLEKKTVILLPQLHLRNNPEMGREIIEKTTVDYKEYLSEIMCLYGNEYSFTNNSACISEIVVYSRVSRNTIAYRVSLMHNQRFFFALAESLYRTQINNDI